VLRMGLATGSKPRMGRGNGTRLSMGSGMWTGRARKTVKEKIVLNKH
jgi:hypothetical protein